MLYLMEANTRADIRETNPGTCTAGCHGNTAYRDSSPSSASPSNSPAECDTLGGKTLVLKGSDCGFAGNIAVGDKVECLQDCRVNSIGACVLPVFDENISPRNLAIIATKN